MCDAEEIEDAISAFESWKLNAEKRMNEKDALIEELKCELVACKNNPVKEGESPPSMIKGLESIKEQVKTLREEEEEKSRTTSSWADVLTNTQKKVDGVDGGCKEGESQYG